MKKYFSLLVLLFLSASCDATRVTNNYEITINKPEDLNVACQKKSFKYFEEKNKQPHDWTSQWRVEKNIIDVKGNWKVDGTEYVVRCRIKRGLSETLMIISIEENKN